jgi:hypothetical protein
MRSAQFAIRELYSMREAVQYRRNFDVDQFLINGPRRSLLHCHGAMTRAQSRDRRQQHRYQRSRQGAAAAV